MTKFRKFIYIYIILLFVILFAGSYTLAMMLAQTQNIKQSEHFVNFNPALPSRILDIRGELITEFSMDEKRELVNYEDISPHLIQALLAREDRNFYSHRGFNIKSIIRAMIGQITGKQLGGGSTITQQIAGLLYCDRTNKSIKRKIQELWWAIQMERRYSKDEILILYLNDVYFGGGTHGVSAASRFYFGHSAKTITPAEAAILVIQLSNPSKYNPFNHPNIAKDRQGDVLLNMVKLGYISKEQADVSFEDYWTNFDYTRIALSAWLTREDKARWFSEYVRRELEGMLYGTMNLYKDGYTVHTTCDLRHQEIADREFQEQLKIANDKLKNSSLASFNQAEEYSNLTSLLTLCFGLKKLDLGEKQIEIKTKSIYRKEINNTLDILSLISGMDDLKTLTKQSTANIQKLLSKKKLEGTLVSVENDTGYITALIGGSEYSEANQLIRAMQSKLQVGSTIKPLIYSAAIDARKITAATQMSDTPCVFENAAGVQYVPNNYGGRWRGTILAYKALPMSLNIPAIKTLELVGFNAAINRMALLTRITDPQEIRDTFEPVYPLALGISSIKPIQLLRAFAIFANQGKAVDPIAIRSVENRDGVTIMDPELDLRLKQKKQGSAIQVISPQNAFIMTEILKKTLTLGTLYGASRGGKQFNYKDETTGRYFRMPIAGKTGTTQNWSDSWAAIYSPYYSTIVWYGFDIGDFSLGTNNAGAVLSGKVATNFMQEIHKGKPFKNFITPERGIINLEVCSKSGMLPSENCGDEIVKLPFLYGTQPTTVCTQHTKILKLQNMGIEKLKNEAMSKGEENINIDKSPLSLDPSIFFDPEPSITKNGKDKDKNNLESELLNKEEKEKDKEEQDLSETQPINEEDNSTEQGNPIEEPSDTKKDDDDGSEQEENPWI